ncbi:MAG: 23S rRNA (pseudouridine(1915)-N(3))-methyltransferase RlmH [Woeseiaceae bacterium]|nr:23S rRNA (pseudouridine(1915)-N(3))-methyltransferase RlmH [Woeseiaceae bacterium]
MHIRLIAVGDRQPSWVDAAFEDYVARLPRQWRFALHTVPVAKRGQSDAAAAAIAEEQRKIMAGLKPDEQVVLLDEQGEHTGSREFASRLEAWLADGRDLCFIIGGPDGVGAQLRSRADFCWSLSRLTLPHGLARVLFAEQLYRAWTISKGHPYHRE